MPVYRLADSAPTIAASAYIAPTATIIGRVVLQDHASVWFGAILRGDNEPITIGASSNVQDSAVLHPDPGFPLSVGVNVTVGAGAVVTERKVFPDGSLILGAPAKVVRELSAQEQANLLESAAIYVKRQAQYRSHLTPLE